MIGLRDHTVLKLVNVNRQDINSAALAVNSEQEACGRAGGVAADNHSVAILVHILYCPFEIGDELGKPSPESRK